MRSPYNASVLWAASFPRSDRPRRRNVHRRMHVEMQHQMREAVRMMHQRGVTDYRVSFEWTTDIVLNEQVHWLNITVEYDAANEQQEEGDNNVISEEVAAARAKHDIKGRTITVTESGKAREIEL